jgi:signal transduction histidine kinase
VTEADIGDTMGISSADEPRITRSPGGSVPRLRLLLETGIALTSELSLEDLLQRVVEAAAALTSARYAALGVVDATGGGLERFITVGASDEERAAIGSLPRGRGILGVLVRDARPVRLRDLSEDPRSVGFPPGHPPMRSFLGVPLHVRGTHYGNLYLTEKAGGAEFTEDDEELVVLLAAQAAVAIENARLWDSTERWLRQLESLREIEKALATEVELPALLDLAARTLRELLEARLVLVVLVRPDGSLRIEAAAGDGADQTIGRPISRERSKAGRVMDRGRSERVDSILDDIELDRRLERHLKARAGIWSPLVVRDGIAGVVVALDRQAGDGSSRFTEEDLRLTETLATRIGVGIDLGQRVARTTLQSVLQAHEFERRRLSVELHDGTAQALTAIQLHLKHLESIAGAEIVGPVREVVRGALDDVRRISVELRPPSLEDGGLAVALRRFAGQLRDQSGIAMSVDDVRGVATPLGEDVEVALYRMAQEALTNVVRHSGAAGARVAIDDSGGMVSLTIEDDGRGFSAEAIAPGRLGLVGMRERIALLGGSLRIDAFPGRGTRIEARLPVGEPAPRPGRSAAQRPNAGPDGAGTGSPPHHTPHPGRSEE